MNRFFNSMVGFVVMTALSGATTASERVEGLDDQFRIGSVTIERVQEPQIQKYNLPELNTPMSDCGGARNKTDGRLASEAADSSELPITLDEILNYGKLVWEIVVANQPQVNASFSTANAMPAGVRCWEDMEQWSAPSVESYKMVFKNLFGIEVIVFNYRVLFTHGGRYKGVGHYLTGVKVLPNELTVAWGYKFNASVSVPSVYNIGTNSNPVGAMEILVDWNVSTPVQYTQRTESFYMDGKGTFKALK